MIRRNDGAMLIKIVLREAGSLMTIVLAETFLREIIFLAFASVRIGFAEHSPFPHI